MNSESLLANLISSYDVISLNNYFLYVRNQEATEGIECSGKSRNRRYYSSYSFQGCSFTDFTLTEVVKPLPHLNYSHHICLRHHGSILLHDSSCYCKYKKPTPPHILLDFSSWLQARNMYLKHSSISIWPFFCRII